MDEISGPREDTSCPCGPCTTRRWLIAWAMGETERKPDDDLIRWHLKRMIEAQVRK